MRWAHGRERISGEGVGVEESEDREHKWIVGQPLGPETLRIQMTESMN